MSRTDLTTRRLQHLEGSCGLVFILAAVGLFAPSAWHHALFGAVLVCAVIGLAVRPGEYDAE